MTLTDLCNYYRECIKQDDLNVCLDGDNFVLVGTGNGIQSEIFRTSEISAFLQRYKASFIHVGYPCYIDDDGKRVPVFIFDISFEVDKIFVDLSSASINRIGLDNCGLLYDDVDYDELLILEEENLDFNNLHDAFGDILSCDDWFDFRYATTLRDCILNECVLFVESINYTKGLASELKRLSNFTRTDYEGSALEKLLHVDAVSNNSGETCPSLCHVTPLNFEQEEAIRDCFNRKIQVITGPPGTGKSQVITNFVINAVIEGKSVLVVSKNNKAVDVVEQRINSLTEQTSFLRLGSNKYATRLTEFISSILTSRVKSGIKKEINEAKLALPIEATSLRNHYRSHPHIINFSNDFFYSNRLRVATNPKYLIEYQSKELGIIWHHVKGYVEKLDAGSVINRGEAKRVVQELEKIICKNGFCGSIGVVTPFRPQANLIRRLISRNTNLRTNSLANDLIIGQRKLFSVKSLSLVQSSFAVYVKQRDSEAETRLPAAPQPRVEASPGKCKTYR